VVVREILTHVLRLWLVGHWVPWKHSASNHGRYPLIHYHLRIPVGCRDCYKLKGPTISREAMEW